MSKEENGNGSNGMGLLSKVVRFVRNPTTNWSDLDQQDADRDSSYSKQALKEMIERKRRNDFVRKREFDMLRKLRRREAMGAQNPNARPSFFQISTSSSKPDDRAMTLKKIDEIEEQMSMQWWKTKHGEASTAERTSRSPLGPGSTGSGPGFTTHPGAMGNETVPPDGAGLHFDAGGDARTNFPLTEPAMMSAPPRSAAAPELPGNNLDLMASGFFGSEMFNVDVDEVAHDPELEEAAIRFANGDDAGAEAGLLDAIADGAARTRHEDTWLALFDLYRATGQHDPFEALAERFTRKFDRSAPAWISIPEVNARVAPARAPAPAPVDGEIHWSAPAALTLEGLAALVAVLRRTSPPWHLDWRALSSIQDEAIEPLYRQLAILAEQPAQLGFAGARHLDAFLQGATPSNDRSVAPAWWLLRMVVLRILRRPDDFELVALNYCVTYEVSPPSWEPPACGFVALDGDSMAEPGNTFIGEVSESQIPTASGETQPPPSFPATHPLAGDATGGPALKVDLAGQILGDATAALDVLDQRLAGADDMVISCAGLVRVDFSAAGTLLNWVSTHHAHGKRVHFSDVHRLVGAFFGVIGISELARVTPRKD